MPLAYLHSGCKSNFVALIPGGCLLCDHQQKLRQHFVQNRSAWCITLFVLLLPVVTFCFLRYPPRRLGSRGASRPCVITNLTVGKKVLIQTLSSLLRMINPWLSDHSGEHLDQPTEIFAIFYRLCRTFPHVLTLRVQGLLE